jgi:ribosomal protein S18 acetylase RimI-like enzyme
MGAVGVMATKYPKAAQVGRQGVDFVSRVASERGCIVRPFDSADVGIDAAIEFVNAKDEPTGDLVLVQVKSGKSYTRGGRFVVQGDRDHFETWARYAVPVVGIVYDPGSGEGRWVDISEHLRLHPERIAEGPFVIDVPAGQEFSVASFPAFAQRFARARISSTRVNVTPNFLIRAWRHEDSKPTRALLASIAADYPRFDDWLARQWQKESVSKKVVEIDHAIAAYSMWAAKDERNVKLQTFIVGQLFRGTAVGQHLLYHELRTWAADPKIERVFVTVASSKAELIDYFEQFGFRVEGISANRYLRTSQAAELVLAKHFMRDVVLEPRDLRRVVGENRGAYLGP